MCVLCTVLWSEEHWAEVDAEQRDGDSGNTVVLEVHAARRGRRLRNRAMRARMANMVLVGYGLELQDWEGSSYIVRDRKGNTAVVSDLASLWKEAEQIIGRPLDPLDPEFLRSIERRIQAGAG